MEDFGGDARRIDADAVGDIVEEGLIACEVDVAREEVEVEQSSLWAGSKRSMLTHSCLSLISKVKNLSDHHSTGYGPSYGDCIGVLTASCRTKTCVHV